MAVIAWAFEVKRGCGREFEKVYGPRGEWARLFRKHPGYRGTELLRDSNHAGRYVTIDRWVSWEAYDRFRTKARSEFEALDARGEALTRSERLLGRFDEL